MNYKRTVIEYKVWFIANTLLGLERQALLLVLPPLIGYTAGVSSHFVAGSLAVLVAGLWLADGQSKLENNKKYYSSPEENVE